MLIDHADAQRLRESGGRLVERLPANLDSAGIPSYRAGGHCHKCGLPRTILTHERVHLALDNFQTDAVKSGDARERLYNVRQAQDWARRRL